MKYNCHKNKIPKLQYLMYMTNCLFQWYRNCHIFIMHDKIALRQKEFSLRKLALLLLTLVGYNWERKNKDWKFLECDILEFFMFVFQSVSRLLCPSHYTTIVKYQSMTIKMLYKFSIFVLGFWCLCLLFVVIYFQIP
jgi:hypothetical protein